LTDTPIRLKGAEIVEDVFGIWPTFHDAEITEITLNRVDVTIFLELLTYGPPSVQGRFRVRFAFQHCDEVELQNFNHQNVIWGLHLSRVIGQLEWQTEEEAVERIKVEFQSIFGASLSFRCLTGKVLGMTPMEIGAEHPQAPTHRI
jgi:hypothetical protein